MNELFGVGTVLGSGFRIWLRNLIPFTLIAALIYSPMIIWGGSLVQGDLSDPAKLAAIINFAKYAVALTLLLNVFVSATITYGVVMELQGKRASMAACIANGFKRLFPALGVGILTALAMAGGLILLIVPGIIVMCMLYVSTPASVIEKPGVMGALRRSRELTAGHKAQIFGILFILGALNLALGKIEEMTLIPKDPLAIIKALPMLMYVDIAIKVVLGSIQAVMAAVSYYYLRNEKEGTSAQELASVFE